MIFENTAKYPIRIEGPIAAMIGDRNQGVQTETRQFRKGIQRIVETVAVTIPPGGKVEIPSEVAQPRLNSNGSRRPAPVEELTGCPYCQTETVETEAVNAQGEVIKKKVHSQHSTLVPADPTERAEWERAPSRETLAGIAKQAPRTDGPDGVQLERLSKENDDLRAQMVELKALVEAGMSKKK